MLRAEVHKVNAAVALALLAAPNDGGCNELWQGARSRRSRYPADPRPATRALEHLAQLVEVRTQNVSRLQQSLDRSAAGPAQNSQCGLPALFRGSSRNPSSNARPQKSKMRRTCGLEVGHHRLVLHLQNLARQHLVPMGHQLLVLQIELAEFKQVVGEGLPFREVLLETPDAAVHRVATGINDFCVRQNGLYKANIGEVIRHLVRKKRGLPPDAAAFGP